MDDTCVFDFQLFEIKRIIIKYCNKSKRISNNRKEALRNLIKIFRLDFEKSTSFLRKLGREIVIIARNRVPQLSHSLLTRFQPHFNQLTYTFI